jgi:hypothetical protein
MIVPIPYVHAGIGAVLTLSSLPLVLRKVPPNPFFGIRMPRAFRSRADWYEINAFGGKCLLGGGTGLLLFGILTRDLAPRPETLAAVPWLVAPLALLAGIIALLLRYFAANLPNR